ncbi:SLATT domain-containing protein [Streptomyces yaizuensis]|uniref:SLATT domain-containing protein n=1 Tax=Streptomyces yaizuensis TaxID=2989713 RepID=A0ABQ5P0K2_9ACTN|nr:SLATT domain-containing protein [Streptomyces sp. YSPA8]GLF95948.1 SLATT domain-containing protein [Streptomyces sp. YSPA8]
MSQPEMQPGGPAREERGDPQRGEQQRAERQRGEQQRGEPQRGDLTGRPFPLGDWGRPAERLDELYRWVETGALRTAEWYLTDRVWKRRTGRALRLAAALGFVAGAALPLADLTGVLPSAAGWGYLALLLGAAALACDRYFGITSGWMRSVATAQAVQRRLQKLQFDWASESVREILGPADGTAAEAAERCLGVLRRFSDDVTELVRAETADWMREFAGPPAPLALQPAPLPPAPFRATPPDPLTAARSSSIPPGARPNMPRQRPPESPR